jgi:DNA adenine methylase
VITTLANAEPDSTTAPIIRWAGSKRQYVKTLLKFMQREPSRYVEPFCGSAAVFFSLSPTTAVLSDVNSSLIAFYRTVRKKPADVYDHFSSIPRDARTYYLSREQFSTTDDPLIRASLFYYLNRNCFNGLYRTSKAGRFNVPYSAKRTGRYPSKEQFVASVAPLRKADIVCDDFEHVVQRHCKAGDLVYLDPPYAGAGRYPFKEYFPGCFTANDVERLQSTLQYLDSIGSKFVLTFSEHLTLNARALGWKRYRFRTRRNIAGDGARRAYVDDVLLTNVF